ncbi:MAG: hypothetical protein WAZ77_08095 [Candidatus Nitrosopolaris sp.]
MDENPLQPPEAMSALDRPPAEMASIKLRLEQENRLSHSSDWQQKCNRVLLFMMPSILLSTSSG